MSMEGRPNRVVLIGYLEEALPSEAMARVEEHLRHSEEWREARRGGLGEVGSGDHSVATVWRRHRLTCPSRDRLGAYLAGGLIPDESDYLQFHLEVIKCRWCLANLSDIETEQRSAPAAGMDASSDRHRRRRFFETSVGHLPPGQR